MGPMSYSVHLYQLKSLGCIISGCRSAPPGEQTLLFTAIILVKAGYILLRFRFRYPYLGLRYCVDSKGGS